MLVIFDIDGTLTRTAGVDAQLFAQAFAEAFGAPIHSADWRDYVDVTDAGIVREAIPKAVRRDVTDADIAAMQGRFLPLLESRLAELGGRTPIAVPGATDLFDALRTLGHRVALATGCWRRSAERKLAYAGVAYDAVPFASCDDHVSRIGIMRAAIAKAGAHTGERVVYVGDGVWDVRATRELGLPLVGVDCEGDGTLAALGLGLPILRDYRNLDKVLHALETAEEGSLTYPLAT